MRDSDQFDDFASTSPVHAIVTRTAEHQFVVMTTSAQNVPPGATFENVTTSSPAHLVVALATKKAIVSCTSHKNVIATPAADHIPACCSA